MENVNHKNFYLKKKIVEEKPIKEEIPEIIEIEEEQPEVIEPEDEDFYSLTKKEQIEKLKEFGLSIKKIKGLKYEGDRVEKLLELSR